MKKSTLIIICLFFFASIARAQTTLSVGDIIFTSFSSSPSSPVPDTFSIVLLTPISSGTVIYFTDRGYNGSGWQIANINEGTISWTCGSALNTGTEISFHGLGAAATINGVPNGTVAQVLGGSATSGLAFSPSGDQVIAFQGSGDPSAGGTTYIAGLHYSDCGITTDAGWDNTACGIGATRSVMPPGLTSGSSAFWTGAFKSQGKYICNGTPYSTAAEIRSSVMNRANWIFDDRFGSFIDVPSGCTFYSTCIAPTVSGQPANGTACAAGNIAFSVTASGTGLSYQWQVNSGSGFTNLGNGSPYSNVATYTLTITNATTGMSGYLYRCIVTGTCGSATSNSASLTVNSIGQWLGATSSFWSNSANWGCATVPDGTTNVIINSGASNMPMINVANAICNNLTIASGASLTFSGATNGVEIKGDIFNNGTFNTSTGKLTFSGTSQSIPGGTFRELVMNGAGSKTLAAPVTISNTLTLTSGHILLGNHDLTIGNSGSISGGSSSSFVVTSGTGALRQQNLGTAGRTGNIIFPVGINTTSFTPLTLDNAGTADEFSVGVMANVYTAYAGHSPTGNVLNEIVVNRTWTIAEATAGGSSATLSFQWTAANETFGFDRNRCFGSHYENNTWTKGPNGVASGSDPYSISLSGVTSFSPFAVGTPGSTLPLTLQSFQANVKSNDVDLNWSTSNEINTAGFEVERSADGVAFSKIGQVASKENNTSTTNLYNYTDKQLAAGNYKYRLKMVDIDGSHTFSNTIAVRVAAVAAGYELYPNPVMGSSVYIRSPNVQSDAVSIKIADLSGRIWHSETVAAAKINSGQYAVTVRQLPAGNYMMIITGSRDSKKQILQFTK